MELQQVNPVRLKPAQGLINLLCRSVFGAAVDLGHQEHLLPVAVPQRFAHPAFARAVVIVPAVVQKVDPVVDGGANDADTLLLVGLLAKVIAPPRPTMETCSPVRPRLRYGIPPLV